MFSIASNSTVLLCSMLSQSKRCALLFLACAWPVSATLLGTRYYNGMREFTELPLVWHVSKQTPSPTFHTLGHDKSMLNAGASRPNTIASVPLGLRTIPH